MRALQHSQANNMAVDADLEKMETRLEKEFRKEYEKIASDIQGRHDRIMASLEKNVNSIAASAKQHNQQMDEIDRFHKEWTENMRDLELDQKRRVAQIEKNLEDSRTGTLKTIGSTELAVKRLEREIELLTKDLAALRKDALTAADLKPVVDRVKKLEK